MRYFFGEWKSAEQPLTVDEVKQLVQLGQERADQMASYPLDKIYSFLSDLSALWANPSYEGRVQALELLPAETGFSIEMTAMALNELPKLLDPRGLEKKLKTELRGLPPVGEESYRYETQTGLSWQPLGLMLHVLAGNVFLGGPGSWLEGLISKNANILKMSSGEKIFMPLFLKSLQEVDADGVISKSVALIDFPSSADAIIQSLKSSVDGIVVWGGEQAVKAYRKDLSLHTRLIAFGPKLSFSVITEKGISEKSVSEIAERIALDVSIWDQNACTAPQMIYLQNKSLINPLAEAIGKALAVKVKTLPAGPADLDTAVEIRKLRTVNEIAMARGQGYIAASEKNLDYTVVVDSQMAITPSPLHRTIRIVPFTDFSDVITEMKSLKGFLQTVGVQADISEQMAIHHQLAKAGATRIVDLGSMAGGEIDDPHDGQYDLSQFVHFITHRLRKPESVSSPMDVYPPKEFKNVLDQRFRYLVHQVGIKDKSLQSIDDLSRLPIMETQTPQHIPKEMFPVVGGYVTRSGGSTGEPKYSIYDGADWERMISSAVPVFQAMGLRRTDRVANCFMAGDLYGSFVSFDHINVRVGMMTFGFAGNVTADFFAQSYKKVGFNVVQGVPAKILPLLREAKKLVPELKIEKILYAGAPMGDRDREWLKSELGVTRIASVIGANDGGQFAFQCAHQSGRFHHTVDDFNYVEIVDDQGDAVPEGQPGRVLITSLLKYNFPLIRYEIGDRARIVPGKCECGSHRRVMEYLGRDDLFCVGMLNFSFEDCRKVLESFDTSDSQIYIKTVAGKDLLTVNVESATASKELESKIKSALLENMGKLKERVQQQALSFEVNLLNVGSIPRDKRSGKVKQVIDERI
jgi:phenylacetate-CoA ligase